MNPKDKTSREKGTHAARSSWPAEVRLELARAIVDRGVSAAALSQTLGIPLTTVTDWGKRYRRYGEDGVVGVISTRAQSKREADPRRSADARRASVVNAKRQHPEQGVRRIRDVLERFEGLGLSETTVRRILHEEGLIEARPPEVPKPRPEERRFERAEPNQLWQSDIFTFLLRRHQRLYVAAFMDDYSRYMVSLVMAHHQRSSLVMEALTRGIADYGAPREVLTDQGRQYTAWRGQTEFEEELRRQGIRHIKSRPHHPQTLGKIERFWKTLWEEFLSRTVFADFGDCQRRVELFVQAYNFRRPHQGIAGLVPADRFFRSAPQVRDAIEKGVAANALQLAHEKPRQKPFYLVGRLGDQDLSVALTGRGLMVRIGAFEETIELRREESDETTQEQGAADSEVAADAGRGGQGEVPDGALGAFGGEAGDASDPGSGDLTGDVLPAGDARPGGDAASPGAEDSGAAELEDSDPGAGVEAETAGTVEAADGAAAASDAEAGEGGSGADAGPENQLDWTWAESFASLDARENESEPFDPGADWRGRALTWDRKLAGGLNDVEELSKGPAGESGAAAAVPGSDGSDIGSPDGERRGAAAAAVSQPIPERAAPGPGRTDLRSPSEAGRPAEAAPGGAGSASGSGAAASGERTALEASGDDGPSAARGARPSDEPAET
jgi:transposase InsO family protein